MLNWLSPTTRSTYTLKNEEENVFVEKYRQLDEYHDEEEVKQNVNRGERRFAVLWEPVKDSNRSIPVFVKSERDKEQIKYAIENDDFLSKVIVGKRLQKVIDAMYVREIKQKEKIIKEGQQGKHLYIIASGKFEVSTEEKGIVNTLNVGKVFGELAILYNARRQATVKALTPSKVWVLDREIYQTIVSIYKIEERNERLKFLQECPVLNEVDERVLKKVAEFLQKEYFAAGKVIFREGDAADKFYIITAGTAAIMKENEGLKGYLSKGKCFGERAILSQGPRQATVISKDSGVECLTLSVQHFMNHFGNIRDITKVSIPALPEKPLEVQERSEKYKQLKPSDFKIIQTIGEGGFGIVEFIQNKKDPTMTFALKRLKRIEMVRDKLYRHIINERDIQMACESPFIVKLYKTHKDKRYLFFWLEMCLGGEVHKWLMNQRRGRFDEPSARFIAACLLEALNYLHERGIIYRDVKPENLLVDSKGYVKLADFSFVKKLSPHERTSTFVGTPEYVAPEILASMDYDRAVDLWAFGILIFELLNGNSPFSDKYNDTATIYRNIQRGFNKVRIPSYFSVEAISILTSLLCHNPEERLGYRIGGTYSIQNHPWFSKSNFNWEDLKLLKMVSPIHPKLSSNVDLRYMNIVRGKPSIPADDKTDYFKDF
ncbi:cGMP-dependent protein kinase, isozyme 1-like [Coccinella septempunctata]|uniref:cGMP-dependent protein kinase, isozyme 1-like n=1 Tax=Coccinella septempunctata TaxID=41139 RepID=UPI001D08B0FA|nr:cGMP-dependent protein kinase, isozyme 1-like [Coccinella septempunctata]